MKNYQTIYADLQQTINDATAGNWNLSGTDAAHIVPLSFGPVPADSFLSPLDEFFIDWFISDDYPIMYLIGDFIDFEEGRIESGESVLTM